jgi:hypothetical protein
MNDPAYVEAARGLAERVMQKCKDKTLDDQLTYAFRLALARKPTQQEMTLLEHLYTDQLTHYTQDKAAAAALLKVGESEKSKDLDESTLAAWTAIANVLLNLDETITKS